MKQEPPHPSQPGPSSASPCHPCARRGSGATRHLHRPQCHPRRPSTWIPPERSHTLELAALAHLAEVKSETWADWFTAVHRTVASTSSVPSTFLEKLGRTIFDALQRFRRRPRVDAAPNPTPPPGCFDALDAAPLVQVWLASKEPGYRTSDTWLNYDHLGVVASSIALNDENAVQLRLSPHGTPHRIIKIVHAPRNGPVTAEDCDVALTIKVDGEPRPLTHVRAGPVFAELIIGERAYLVAAISSLLAVVEVHAREMRIVWGGQATALPEFNIELSTLETLVPVESGDQQLAQRDGHLAVDEHARQAEAQLAAERAALADERRAREAAEQQLDTMKKAVVNLDKEVRAELTRQAEAHAKAEQQATIAGEMLRKWIEAHALKDQECQEAVKERYAAEERAAHAETANRLAELAMTRALDHANEKLAAAAQRAHDAEQAAIALAARLTALEAERAEVSHTSTQRDAAECEQARLTEQLLAVETELAGLRRAQANDAAHLTHLIEDNRIPEALTFFVARALGTPVEDIDQALTILEQQRRATTPEPAPPTLPSPPPTLQPSPTPAKIGRNEPCPCGSGKKFKRCCWLTAR